MRRLLLIFVLAASSKGVYAQKIEPGYTFNVEIALPNAISNAPFNDIMQGLASGAVYGQYSFPFHLNVGAGFKYSLFTVNEFAVPAPIYGSMQTGVGFVKIGYDKFHNDRFATDVSVKVGYAENIFNTYRLNEFDERIRNFYQTSSVNVESTLGLILSADERNAYRLVLGHGVSGFGFRPEMIGLESNEGYDESEFTRLSNYFIVGFGYTYYFGQKSSTD